MKKTKIVTFSLDYNGVCEDIEEVYKDDTDLTGKVSFKQINDFVEVLKGVEGFKVSPHRTNVNVFWYDNDTMKIMIDYFTEPDWDSFKEIDLDGLTPVKFPV